MLETSSLHGTTCYGYDRHNRRISQSQGGQSIICDYHLPHPRVGIPADDALTYRLDDGHGSMQAALASTTLQDAGEQFDATLAAYDLRGTRYHRAAGRFTRLDSPLPGALAAVWLWPGSSWRCRSGLSGGRRRQKEKTHLLLAVSNFDR